jgi:preprotein translocase subunit SecF
MSKPDVSWGSRLYRGEVSYDFIGNQKRWYMISGSLLAVAVISLLTLSLNFSLDFRGGSQFTVVSPTLSAQQANSTVTSFVKDPTVQTQTSLQGREVVVKTTPLTPTVQISIQNALAKEAGIKDPSAINVQTVSGSWGKDITNKAITGLIVFVILVMLYMAIFYEWKMAVAALVALVHDLVITAGIYALSGFQVSPATVIGFLTILGYSLYDTVVVFDKVKENTKGIGAVGKVGVSYTQAANLAVNQTLIRSLNTSLIAMMPVAALLFSGFLSGGAGVLQDLALALLVGIAVGTYSSIFIATPLMVDMKEREPDMRVLARKAAKSGAAVAERVPTQERVAASVTVVDSDGPKSSAVADGPRGPRNQPVRDRTKNRPSGKKR